MNFLEEALKAKGLYVVALGNTLFTETEDKNYVLHTFPFKYHADYYRQSMDFSDKNPFTISFWSLKKLWKHYVAGSIRTFYISSCDVTGKATARDVLFTNPDTVVH